MKKKPEAIILTTTLRLLRNAHACTPRYTFLREALGPKYGDNKPINLLAILKTNGLDDALWALQATAQNCNMVARLVAADFAARVLPIWAKKYPKDDRPAKAIKAAKDFARGKITREELAAAGAAARDAAWDAAWAAEKNRQIAIFVSYLLESEGAE
jgi:hypothetical protein